MAFLLFDLDGTLTDPARGITACIQHAMRQMGHGPPDEHTLHRFIGPPLRGSLAELLRTDDALTLDAALGHYREWFSTVGIYENELYPFVRSGLAALRAGGHRTWVVTSKPTPYARRIIEHFNLTWSFEHVYGSELSGERSDKAELLRHVLRCEGLDPDSTWMIGDRSHDMRGGIANGLHTAGALWGYGSARELTEAGADILIDDLGALHTHLERRPDVRRS
jgi:phosphoglycolate phosphatase